MEHGHEPIDYIMLVGHQGGPVLIILLDSSFYERADAGTHQMPSEPVIQTGANKMRRWPRALDSLQGCALCPGCV